MSIATNIQHRYATREFESAPLKFFIDLMSLQSISEDIKAQTNILPILSGIVLYRSLPRRDQSEVNAQVLELKNGRIKQVLFGLIGQIQAIPLWFCWSLSDAELTSWFEANKAVKDALSPWGIFDSGSVTVSAVASTIYGSYKMGMKSFVNKAIVDASKSETIRQTALRLGLSESLSVSAGYALGACVLVLVGILASADYSQSQAKRELLARGMVSLKEL